MKKSKLLMPLTGIAAIGAFAPVVAMTSCGNKYAIVDKSICGNIIDEYTESMTNRLGAETLYKNDTEFKESIQVGIGATLTKKVSEIERNHIIKRTINQAGKEGATGTAFIIDTKTTTVIDGTEYEEKKWYTKAENGFTLKINSDKMAKLVEEGATTTEESFSFTVTYEEFESTTSTTAIGKQDVTYTVVACPKLHDCNLVSVYETPLTQLNATALSGDPTITIGTTQLTLAREAETKLTVSIKDKVELVDLIDDDTTWIGTSLVFAAGESVEVAKESTTFGGFEGTLGKDAEAQWLGQASYFGTKDKEDFYMTFAVKPQETGKYVVEGWNSTITLQCNSEGEALSKGGIRVYVPA